MIGSIDDAISGVKASGRKIYMVSGNTVYFYKFDEIHAYESIDPSSRDQELCDVFFVRNVKERNMIPWKRKPAYIVKSPRDVPRFINEQARVRRISAVQDEIIGDMLSSWCTRSSTCHDLIARILSTEDVSTYLEIGVWKGLTIMEIAKRCPWIHLYGIDPLAPGAELLFERAGVHVDMICGDFNQDGREMIASIGEKMDAVYYDADHSEQATRNALDILAEMLEPGSIVFVHDSIHIDHVGKVVDDFIDRGVYRGITLGAEDVIPGIGRRRGLSVLRLK